MAPHSSTLAWKIPWMEEPGGLQSMGSLRVEHDWATSLSLFTFMHWRRKWHPTPVFLPGESQGRGAWWAAVCGVAQSWTRLKRLSSSSSSSVCVCQSRSPNLSLPALSPGNRDFVFSTLTPLCFVKKFVCTLPLESACKWCRVVSVFLCLAYFSQCNSLRVYSCCCTWYYSVPFYGWVIVHCTYAPYPFLHSSVDGHLGFFHVLAIVNNTAMNIGVHCSFWIMVFSGFMPRSGAVGS